MPTGAKDWRVSSSSVTQADLSGVKAQAEDSGFQTATLQPDGRTLQVVRPNGSTYDVALGPIKPDNNGVVHVVPRADDSTGAPTAVEVAEFGIDDVSIVVRQGGTIEYYKSTDGATWVPRVTVTSSQNSIIPDHTVTGGSAAAAVPGLTSVDGLDAWGVSRRVRRIFNVAADFDFNALGYADRTAVYIRNIDPVNGINITYGTGGTHILNRVLSDGTFQTISASNDFNLQPSEIAVVEKDGANIYVSVLPGERVSYFTDYADAVLSAHIRVAHDGIAVIRDVGEIWLRKTTVNSVAFPANGIQNDDWFKIASKDPQSLLLNYINVEMRSAGTNAGSSVALDFVDIDGNTYPDGDWAYSADLTQYAGGTATIVTDKAQWTGAIGIGRNKQGTVKFYYTGSFPNGLSAINAVPANGASTQGVQVSYLGTNYNDDFANVGSITEPLYWTTSQEKVSATDQAAPLLASTEYAAGTVFSHPEADNSDPDYQVWFNWRVNDGETITDTDIPNATEAEFLAIKSKLTRFGVGTVEPDGLVPDWAANTEYKTGDKVVATMPINANFISSDGAIVGVEYIFKANTARPNTIGAFNDAEVDSGAWDLIGVYRVNGTDDRVLTGAGTIVLDPLVSLSNSNLNEYIHWTTTDASKDILLIPAPGFVTIWKDYTGLVPQPTAANETFTLPANSQMWVHRVGNAVQVVIFSNEGGKTAKNALEYPAGNFTALPVNDSGEGDDGAVYKIPTVDALVVNLPNKATMDLAGGTWRVRISGEWAGLAAEAIPLSFVDDTANGIVFGDGLPDSGNEWVDLVLDLANDRWIATTGGDVTLTQVIPTYAVHTEVPSTVRLWLIDGTGASAEGLYRKETGTNSPNYVG